MVMNSLRSATTRRSTRVRPTSISAKREPSSPLSSPSPPAKLRKIKHESETAEEADIKPIIKTEASPSRLKDRKLKAHTKNSLDGPFPTFLRPSPSECDTAHRILASLHGPRNRPVEVVASTTRAGCGDSPSVLDALVRTILSQNTSDTNSTRAKLSMDKVYGGSDHWDDIVAGGPEKLEEAIRSGGLSKVKSKVIIRILEQAKEKYGEYSLDHLHKASTEDAMEELLGFDGVGPKTASCVLLFCLQREDFAVDTHVHRITGLLGWRPKTANREQTYHHLNKRIPDQHKYGLHILLVTHGKRCDECKAGGKNSGRCELRRAFRNLSAAGKEEGNEAVVDEVVKGEVKDDGVKEEMESIVKEDELASVKKE